jgi:hypothetical protein
MVGNCSHVIAQEEGGLRLSMFIYVYGRRFCCPCYSCRYGQKRNEEALCVCVCSHLLNTFSSRDRRGAECLTWRGGGVGGTPLGPLPPPPPPPSSALFLGFYFLPAASFLPNLCSDEIELTCIV